MTCEKQFLPANTTFLYCSEACRLHDLNPAPTQRSHSYTSSAADPTSPPLTPYTRPFSSLPSPYLPDDGPDIIPRFSPTQSRPRSYFSSDPYPAYPAYNSSSYQPFSSTPIYSSSPIQSSSETVYANTQSSSALASLRELVTALPKTSPRTSRNEPESPPKSAASSIRTTGSGGVWNYMPFTSGSGARTAEPTPGNSYGNYAGSASYGAAYGYGYGGRSREDLHGYASGNAAVGGFGNTGGMGMDRPLPPRSGPGGYGHRPRSIDLVTPYSTGH